MSDKCEYFLSVAESQVQWLEAELLAEKAKVKELERALAWMENQFGYELYVFDTRIVISDEQEGIEKGEGKTILEAIQNAMSKDKSETKGEV